jgi:DNA-binding MarR family transcriptional regulator
MNQRYAENAAADAAVDVTADVAADASVLTAPSWRASSIGYLVWRSHLVFRRLLDSALAELGVNIAQVGIADELIEHGPRSVADLARMLGVTPQGAALAVSQLRKLGWLTPSPASGRGRTILLEITDLGRENHRKAAGIIEQVDESLTRGISADEHAAATRALRVIAGATPPALV